MEAAEKRFEQALKSSELSKDDLAQPEVLAALGWHWRDAGELAKAQDAAVRVLQNFDDNEQNPRALSIRASGLALGTLCDQDGDQRPNLEQALDDVNEALDSDMDGERRYVALMLAVTLYEHLGEQEPKIECLEEAVELVKGRVRVMCMLDLAQEYHRAGRLEDALHAAKETLESAAGPAHEAELRYLIAIVAQDSKEPEEALIQIDRVLEVLESGTPLSERARTLEQARLARVAIMQSLGSDEEAHRELKGIMADEAADEDSKSEARSYLQRMRIQKAGVHFKKGDIEEAKAEMLPVVAEHTANDLLRADALNFLGECHLQLGEYQEAVDCFHQALESPAADDEHAKIHARSKSAYASASMLFQQQKFKEAKAAYRKIYEESRNDDEFKADVVLRLALTDTRLGDTGSAKDWLGGLLSASFPTDDQKQAAAEALRALTPKSKSWFSWGR